jgi:aminoglycoside phosphotransferase (APT) family kinase protein
VTSPTQRQLGRREVAEYARAAFDLDITGCAELTGGGYAAVWRVDLADGRTTVLKVAPPPDVGLLRYERDLVAAEAAYFDLVHERLGDVPIPHSLALGSDPVLGDWLFMTYLPGTTLIAEPPPDSVREQLGALLARVHSITGPHFGYTGDRSRAESWPEAFAAIVDDLLADAADWGVALPWPAARIREAVARHADVLAEVDRPALLHFDVWDGNVLASDGTLTGLVDGERCLYGDPLVDFVVPLLFAPASGSPPAGNPLLRGYGITLDRRAERRLALYRMHLSLLMVAEMPSRGMTAESHPNRWELLESSLSTLDEPI